jgi:predicted aspartyl protease
MKFIKDSLIIFVLNNILFFIKKSKITTTCIKNPSLYLYYTSTYSTLNMKFKYVVLFLHVFLFSGIIAWTQVSGFYLKGIKRKVEIPFSASNNLIIVPVAINGHEPMNFLLDTGVKSNLLFSKSLGDSLGLTYSRKLSLVGADGISVLTASVSSFNTLDLGKIEGIYQTILVLDEEFLELESVIGIPIAGIIGYEFFKYNPVKVDFDQQILTFFRNNHFKRRPLGFRNLSISIENDKPYVNALLKQENKKEMKVKLLIDTGANHGLMLNRETSEEIVLPKMNISSDLGRSLGGDLYGHVGRVKKLNVSGLNFTQIITSFPQENEFSHVILQSGRQGTIGADILSKMTLIFDYANEKLFLKKGEKFKSKFEFDMSGITPRVFFTDDKRFYVFNVREGSPAYLAGVKIGDEILAVNKLPKELWELPDLIKLFRSSKGNTIYLTVKRLNFLTDGSSKEEIIEFKFQLQRQI